MPSSNCTFQSNEIFWLSRVQKIKSILNRLFRSNPMDSLQIYAKKNGSCIWPSFSQYFLFLLFFFFPPLLVTSPVGKRSEGRGRGGRTALSASYPSKRNQPVRQEMASCILQPGLTLISLSHCRAPFWCASVPQLSRDTRLHLLSPATGTGREKGAEEQPLCWPFPSHCTLQSWSKPEHAPSGYIFII